MRGEEERWVAMGSEERRVSGDSVMFELRKYTMTVNVLVEESSSLSSAQHPSRLTDDINMQHSSPEPLTLTRGLPHRWRIRASLVLLLFFHMRSHVIERSRREIWTPFCRDDPPFNPEERRERQTSIHLAKHAG